MDAWNGQSGVNAASQVVSIGRCLLRLVWNHLSLGTKGAVKLVPHKRLLISTGELSKIIHTCNTLRDATVVGLWSLKYKAYENATYMYLGGGTEYHPPYVYSLVFRDVSFEIAYSLAAIVLALSEGYVNGDLFYSVNETTSMPPKEGSDFAAERKRHTGEVQKVLNKLNILSLVQSASADSLM